ncbi:MAG: hypothetical protein OEZ06_21765 [Myxococcales bacterium]|nr:hypothetical protein [Myxococcales bacterium]
MAGAKLKVALRESQDLAAKLETLLGSKPKRLREFVHGVVEEIAVGVAPKQLVLLVDGLDKFVVPRDRVVAVYRAMADLFFQQAALLRLPASHVAYVIPPYLGLLHKGLVQAYGRLHILPSVEVRERRSLGGGRHEPGLRCLEEVASRRLDLDALCGAERRQAIDELALASGGHVRDLFNLLRQVLRKATSLGPPVPLSTVGLTREALSQDRGGLFRPTLQLLDEVRRSESLASLDQDRMGAFADAMDEYLILGYRNGSQWFDVHPLVEPLLDEGLAALRRLENPGGTGLR